MTKECLSHDCKDVYKYNFFKNNLLHSNIWSLELELENENKSNKENESDNSQNNINILFNQIKTNVVSQEVIKQQKYIKQEMVKIAEKYDHEWEQLRSNIKYENIAFQGKLSQKVLETKFAPITDLMKEKGVKCDYTMNQLPSDNKNGFIGKEECDNNFYLTKLLTASHQIDPIFHKVLKEYFDIKNFGIPCVYTAAPVKTRSRCQVKAKLDCNHLEWPYTSHILDYIRASLVFDNISDLISGFNKFYSKFGNYQQAMKPYNSELIPCIVRIKNDFSIYANVESIDQLKNLPLNSFDYGDIKCNILIECNGICIVGELQFLLKFMLNAKKIGHSIHSFLKKEELYIKLFNQDESSRKKNLIYDELNKIILSKNMSRFSAFFQMMNDTEKD